MAITACLFSGSARTQEIDFGSDIWPIMEFRCIECHGPEKQREDLRFDDLEWLSDDELLGGGDASESLIYELISLPADDQDRMPKKRDPMTQEELELFRRWLEGGAKSDGWAVPENITVARSGGELQKVDILAELAKGVDPAPEDAMDALRARGALVLPLANNNNLVRVDFNLVEDPVSDDDLALLAPLTNHVTWLGLAHSNVTDAGLAAVAKLPKLTRLDLTDTQVGDAGLAHLAGLEHLEYLNLVNTQVGDDGAGELSALKGLRKVFLWRSKATLEGAQALESANPDIDVNLGIELAIEKPAEDILTDLSALFDEGSCCAVAHAKGEACAHECCVAAAAKNLVCIDCNPGAAAKQEEQ